MVDVYGTWWNMYHTWILWDRASDRVRFFSWICWERLVCRSSRTQLGGGFKYFLFHPNSRGLYTNYSRGLYTINEVGGGFIFLQYISPLFGEDSHFDSYFSDGLKPPTS